MPRSCPSISLASRQLQSREPRPFAKGSYRSKAQSTPESEEDFSLAAKPIKDRLRVDSGPSSEGRDESRMEALPALDTQHDIGVDTDISSEGVMITDITFLFLLPFSQTHLHIPVLFSSFPPLSPLVPFDLSHFP